MSSLIQLLLFVLFVLIYCNDEEVWFAALIFLYIDCYGLMKCFCCYDANHYIRLKGNNYEVRAFNLREEWKVAVC